MKRAKRKSYSCISKHIFAVAYVYCAGFCYSLQLMLTVHILCAKILKHDVLTEKPIIHRDVKSSNIMLTENFRGKVSDFGFARIGPTEAEQTHILTKVKGTAGYLDPEYLKTYKLTPKSDVFSFGILLIEILSARRPVELKRRIDERITVRWVSFMAPFI